MSYDEKEKSSTASGPFRVGDWWVEPETGLLRRGDEEARLEPRVMDLLVCLASRPGEVMSREELETRVWAGMIVGYDSLSSAIIKLRKALGDNSRSPSYIATVSKRGYQLIATVSPPETPEPEPEPESGPEPTPQGRTTPAPTRPVVMPARLMAGLAVVLVLLAALWLGTRTSEDRSTKPVHRVSLVVLPFYGAEKEAGQEYFSDGITDDLISDLSRYSALDVVARRTAYVYKSRRADIQTIAEELGVQYVVDGDVRRDGEHVRLNVQLVDAASGMNVWAQRFDREADHIFEVQDDIRANILRAMSVQLSSEEQKRAARRDTSSFAAYDLFLQGQAALVTRASAADSHRAQRLMEQAIQLDPSYARAYAALALIHADAYRFGWSEDPETTRELALKTGQRAVELDADSHQARWILGYIYLFLFADHERAITLARQASELAPRDLDAATLLAVTYAFNNTPEQAHRIITDIMADNDQYSSMVPSVLGLSNLLMGRLEDALKAYDQSLLINPSRIQGNAYRAVILYRMGNKDDAEFQVEQLYALHPNFDLQLWSERQPFKDQHIIKQLKKDLVAAGVKAAR